LIKSQIAPIRLGEAVSPYAAKIAQVLGPRGLWISACSNGSFGYLPTAQILKEGGHESMCLTLDFGLFSPQVEDTLIGHVRRLARRAGRAAVSGSSLGPGLNQ
jgi:hypothetical protein